MFLTNTQPNGHSFSRGLRHLGGFHHLLRELEHFDRATTRSARPKTSRRFLWEQREDHYILQGALPGLHEQNLELTATAEGLTLRASTNPEVPAGFKPVHRERRATNFERTWRFADPVDLDAIEATLKDGVLTLKVPKMPRLEARKITITTA